MSTLTPRAVDYLLALDRAAGDIEARAREQIGAEGMAQFFRFLDVIADGEPVLPEDRAGTPPAVQRLRWQQGQEPGDGGPQ